MVLLSARVGVNIRAGVIVLVPLLTACTTEPPLPWPPLGASQDSGSIPDVTPDTTTPNDSEWPELPPFDIDEDISTVDTMVSDADAIAPKDDIAGREDIAGHDADNCPTPPSCGPAERIVDCACVSVYDRKCVTDADCRPDEECRAFEAGYSVCWWEAPPVHVCPGSAQCMSGSEGSLLAAAVSRVVTPVGYETPLPDGLKSNNTLNFGPAVVEGKWRDCGYDNICPGEPGYLGPDEGEGDGIMQGAWLAGFSSGRPAQNCPAEFIGCEAPECCISALAHDDILVQIAVLRRGDTTVAFAALDSVGFFHTDADSIRAQIPPELGIDLFVMAATHNHEGPDTAGQWGPGEPVPQQVGRDPKFLERIRTETLAGLAEAVASLESAEAHAAVLKLDITQAGITDSRTPYIFDNNVPVIHLRRSADGSGIATLLSVANHPEVLWAGNPYITSDYPHYVRKYIQQGLAAVASEDAADGEERPALAGLGGVTVFFAGALGGLINPGKGGAVSYGGEVLEEHSFRMADAVGQAIAKHVLEAWHAGQFDAVAEPALAFATRRFLTGVKNSVFQLAAYILALLPRDVYNATQLGFLSFVPNLPQLQSQTAVIKLGDVVIFTGPGEVFPETLVGGFPGKSTTQNPVVGDIQGHRTPPVCGANNLPLPEGEPPGAHPCVVKPNAENPPDWAMAPEPPYGYDWVPGDKKFFIGLGMDFIGYMVPEYDYQATDYFSQAPGDHYEETNGVGPAALADWKAALDECVQALNRLPLVP